MTKISTEKLIRELTLSGEYTLLEKLLKFATRKSEFSTLVVPQSGFSESDTIHNMVLDWAKGQKINIVNPELEITRLERSCSWKHPKPPQLPQDFIQLYSCQ